MSGTTAESQSRPNLLRRAARVVYGLHVPVWGPIRWFYAALYWLGHAAAEATRIVLAALLWRPLFTARCARAGRGLRIERLPYITGGGRIEIGDEVRISGKIGVAFTARVHADPVLKLGDRVFVGHGCAFAVAQEISIGDDCLIAGFVHVRDNDGHPLEAEARRRRDPVRPENVAPVRIEANAWIGAHAAILKGVTVGANAVIAANAVVTRDVPANAVVGGNPAKVIRMLE